MKCYLLLFFIAIWINSGTSQQYSVQTGYPPGYPAIPRGTWLGKFLERIRRSPAGTFLINFFTQLFLSVDKDKAKKEEFKRPMLRSEHYNIDDEPLSPIKNHHPERVTSNDILKQLLQEIDEKPELHYPENMSQEEEPYEGEPRRGRKYHARRLTKRLSLDASGGVDDFSEEDPAAILSPKFLEKDHLRPSYVADEEDENTIIEGIDRELLFKPRRARPRMLQRQNNAPILSTLFQESEAEGTGTQSIN